MSEKSGHEIAVLGAGTIGLSFVALHLKHHDYTVAVCDTRPGLEDYVRSTLPKYLSEEDLARCTKHSRLRFSERISDAVNDALFVQECLPENVALKQRIWRDVEAVAPSKALLWSSTSGVPASLQSELMKDKTRLLVVHPYNPPHIMPLLEIVPSPSTSQDIIDMTMAWWQERGKQPVLIRKETTGFVANRLAFALFQEAVHLVDSGVVGVEELDSIVENSMGPRWAVAGPFKSYHAGGGQGGLAAFMQNIGDTVGNVWDDLGSPSAHGDWRDRICAESQEAYGLIDTSRRDRITREILKVVDDESE